MVYIGIDRHKLSRRITALCDLWGYLTSPYGIAFFVGMDLKLFLEMR